ncbi:amidohydrolase [Pseudonocardia acaciae]|uniref:amidohydrolase n=1 Tax=Pseudonocardia acaciae TaxID=551276 RepID=UPI000491BE04|nr:amidohydrolase [Pseudonocardia acaciae]
MSWNLGGPADLVVLGARIRTLDPSLPAAEALAARRGRITAVGDRAEVRAQIGRGTEVLDGRGMCLVPGLIDAHAHPVWGAELAVGVDLGEITDMAELVAALGAHARRLGPDEWVRGRNLRYEVFGGRPIDNEAIDRAVAGRPALLLCYDLHTAVATPRALALAGLDAPRDFGDASTAVSRDGGLTGELREPSAYRPVLAVAGEPGEDPPARRVARVLRDFARAGLTGAHVMDGTESTLRLLRELERSGELSSRLVVALWQEPAASDEDIARAVDLSREHGRRWRCGMVKLFVDGVVETGTAWLAERDCCGGGRASFWPDPARYREVVGRFASAGIACASHAIGDRAVRAALDAYEAAPVGSPDRDRAPHRIEHLEIVADDDIERLAADGLALSMQPVYLRYRAADGRDPWTSRLHPHQVTRGFRLGEMLAAGARIALGSDWPVAPFDPRLGMAWARLRRPPGVPDAPVLEPEQRLTGLQALHGYTTAAAAAAGETRLGRIVVGHRADLTGFAADPVLTGADELVDLPVRLTVVDGEVVHHSD